LTDFSTPSNLHLRQIKNILNRLCLLFSVLALLLTGACSDRTKRETVHDPGKLLSTEQRQHILDQHRALLSDLDIDFFLHISEQSIPDISVQGVELFQKYQVGKASKNQQGVLLLVDPVGQQVRLEISYSLEPIFPDSFVGYIQRRQMLPFFHAGQIGHGLEATVELLVGRAVQADLGNAFDPAGEIGSQYLSGGGGADIIYDTGNASAPPETKQGFPQVSAQTTPQEALSAYLQVLATYNKRPDLHLYSPKTRIFFSKWVMTDAQFDNVSQNLAGQAPEQIFIQGERAVIRYPVAQRNLSPFFLVHSDEGWMFDFATMNRVIGFNHKNQWHFKAEKHPYAFAFTDLRFDSNGFPFD
jgi:hypothetical protein